jgi:hypothetical protein
MCLIRKNWEVDTRAVRRPDPMEYCNVSDCVTELVETYDLEWVPVSSVLRPCFILHIDAIQKACISCKGIDNLYFIRFRESKNAKLIPISQKERSPFYPDHRFPLEESYPERIWMALISLKLEVQKALCRGGEWNGRTTMAKLVGIPPCFFGYLQEELRLLVDGPLQEDVVKTSRCRKAIADNLSARNVRTKMETGIIHVDEESHLDAVQKVFGQSFGVGICAPVPSMKMPRCNLSLKATVWL